MNTKRDVLPSEESSRHTTACILCELNCGIEVELGGDDGRRFVRITGDRSHPASQGYLCQKAARLDHYQNSRDRVLSPLRRRSDGSFEEIDWDTAITEVAERLVAIRERLGGDKIFYFGGGGQGNHLAGGYAAAARKALGIRYRSNALAQEKTGEFWVHQQMVGNGVARGDFHSCEVGIFLGKNPWQSHGIPRARVTLREMSKDPERCLVVIDPVLTETAAMADIHLRPRPGTDAWLLVAVLVVLAREDLIDHDWIAEHTQGSESVLEILRGVDVHTAARRCGVSLVKIEELARRIARASSVSIFEDLGVQMNRDSTLVSYLGRLLWMLTGNFAKAGAQNVSSSLVPLFPPSRSSARTPVGGHRIIAGLTPCNTIAEEILTDHPDRYRAMIVESANPAHSLADSPSFREALRALDLVVVVDVAMTETARLADYVLPTTTQFEKAEATFFNFEFPHNIFHLRRPILTPPTGPLPEPEIHSRLVEAIGALPTEVVSELRSALRGGGRLAFAQQSQKALARADVAAVAPVVLYRTLGETLGDGLESAAILWAAAHRCAAAYPESIQRAGVSGDGPLLGDGLFDAILNSPSGLVFTDDEPQVSWERLGRNSKLRLEIPEMLEELRTLLGRNDRQALPTSDEFPFTLSAGERRSYTANTIYRDPDWRKRDADGALRISPTDATALGLTNGDAARITTRRGTAEVTIEVNEGMPTGHLSLPNGLGVDYPNESGERRARGVAPNELTSAEDRDPIAGTPWHKTVAARLEALATH